jgi:hypothetical protein
MRFSLSAGMPRLSSTRDLCAIMSLSLLNGMSLCGSPSSKPRNAELYTRTMDVDMFRCCCPSCLSTSGFWSLSEPRRVQNSALSWPSLIRAGDLGLVLSGVIHLTCAGSPDSSQQSIVYI